MVRLKPCPESPNCVCSQDSGRAKIDPLPWLGSLEKTQERLRLAIGTLGRFTYAEEKPAYWRVEFRSRLLSFVDDVEFLFDSQNRRIDVRSASRTGHYDFEVNRQRVEALRKAMLR